MSATNDSHPAAGARPVALVRYRPGVTGEAARTVHLIPLPNGGQENAAHALCGALLRIADIETEGGRSPCAAMRYG
ncbi:MAG TPA: hypothetical protein VJT72_08400 [Pseudonocardiaceae bacterium]|nr:hypothetical protein [Pseudonocardiaceae bacterium]